MWININILIHTESVDRSVAIGLHVSVSNRRWTLLLYLALRPNEPGTCTISQVISDSIIILLPNPK